MTKISSQPFGTFPFPKDYTVAKAISLNQTNLSGGHNKFYISEQHVSKDGKQFRLYSRYGRVGHHGTEEERIPDQNQASLEAAFNRLVKEKTAPGKYVEVRVAQSKMGSNVAQTLVLSDDIKTSTVTSLTVTSTPTSTVTSTSTPAATKPIHPSIVKLVERLYNEAGQAVRSQLSGSLKTSADNPLGTLTLTQIAEGARILTEVQKLLVSKPALIDSIKTEVLDLSNQFYSAIPQTMALRPRPKEGKTKMDDWLKRMALNNARILDEKQELLELLADVQGVVSGFAADNILAKHDEIGCEYMFLESANPERQRIEHFVTSTRSDHHSWRIGIGNVWRIAVNGQAAKHDPVMQRVGNIKPLFHGSRPANILGICKHGLLMRPPGAVITGSLMGNGIYFADQASKSEQYSMARFGGNRGLGDSYFMFVADVALGNIKEYATAQQHLIKAPPGFDSVKGVKGQLLLHNEFITYTLDQQRLRYLVEFSTR